MASLCHSSVTIRGPCKAASGERSNEGELVCDQAVRLVEMEQCVLGTGGKSVWALLSHGNSPSVCEEGPQGLTAQPRNRFQNPPACFEIR